jgi:AraC family transcriptional regulator
MAASEARTSPNGRVQLRHARIRGFSFTEGTHPADSGLPWHWHATPTICIVLEGSFTEVTAGTGGGGGGGVGPMVCSPSTVKFMPAGERHCDQFDRGPVRGLLIEVEPDQVEALRPHAAALDQRVHYQGGPVGELALRVHRELCRMDEAAPLAIEGLMLELLAIASRQAGENGGGGGGYRRTAPWLEQARDLIEAELAGRLGVTGVAATVGVHPVTLARAFRRTFGCTMGDYVRRRRIERAMDQLRDSGASLAEIALANGFADQSHFSNLFRRYVGITPSRFRRVAPPPRIS